jgi:ATP-binding cassette subfamily B protein
MTRTRTWHTRPSPCRRCSSWRGGSSSRLGRHGRRPDAAPVEAIRFEGVSFRYTGQSADVLSGLDLEIPAGRSLAIVGANGAGKTTLIKLLCRLYDPTDGRISVDRVDLSDVDPTAWQRRVAAIFQDFVQYHLSARENVALGAPELAADEARLRAAAEKAGALDLIESLPRGWDTVLSRQYTGGVDLSGGQWQRVALARALFAVEAASRERAPGAAGARVLILDEPTANLDVRAEAARYDRFLDITASLTTILISHRFSTVRRADRIVVLEGGRVVEDGSHDQLIALDGRYATMFRLQAARFADDAEPVEETLT